MPDGSLQTSLGKELVFCSSFLLIFHQFQFALQCVSASLICVVIRLTPFFVARDSPRFGIAHALCLGLAPWLAAEVPILVDSGMVKHKDDEVAPSQSSS